MIVSFPLTIVTPMRLSLGACGVTPSLAAGPSNLPAKSIVLREQISAIDIKRIRRSDVISVCPSAPIESRLFLCTQKCTFFSWMLIAYR
ncbi:hypothetical protein DERA104750_12125 [Deinococcus radiodurans]|jgi:hypothetical protein|nr:hypothetical protein DRO_B0034 [Deinococcus radiodurans R1 = ATCC 13939 = DSM 20539]